MSSFIGQPRFPLCKKEITLANIMKQYSFFDENNPATYKLYIMKNPNLSTEEREYYERVSEFMETERQDEMNLIRGRLRDRDVVMADNDLGNKTI
tara:strand:+ start:390 stop:674 length:285 start_codon:yes stop_codon:yes gene_type:complete